MEGEGTGSLSYRRRASRGVDFIDAIQIATISPGDLAEKDARFDVDDEDWNADITYVVATNFTTLPDSASTPEPGILLGLSILGLGWLLKQ